MYNDKNLLFCLIQMDFKNAAYIEYNIITII